MAKIYKELVLFYLIFVWAWTMVSYYVSYLADLSTKSFTAFLFGGILTSSIMVAFLLFKEYIDG